MPSCSGEDFFKFLAKYLWSVPSLYSAGKYLVACPVKKYSSWSRFHCRASPLTVRAWAEFLDKNWFQVDFTANTTSGWAKSGRVSDKSLADLGSTPVASRLSSLEQRTSSLEQILTQSHRIGEVRRDAGGFWTLCLRSALNKSFQDHERIIHDRFLADWKHLLIIRIVTITKFT